MIIIIEGIDGSGKTELAKQISKQTKYPIIHRSNPKTEEEKQLMMGEYLQAIKNNKNVIFDRCWYSELAYGPVMRDASIITYPQMYALERMLAKTGALIIHCTGQANVLWQRCQKRGEDYIVSKDDFLEIYANYGDIFAAPHLVPVVNYVYEDL